MRKRETRKRRNPMARAVRGSAFRLRVVRNKRRYSRKAKHRRRDRPEGGPEGGDGGSEA